MAGVTASWARVLFRRRVLVMGALLLQIGFLVFLIAGSSLSFQHFSWALNVLSIVVCVYILNRTAKSAYKLTWIFLILMFPIFGGVLYIFFLFHSNPRKLRRYLERVTRRSAEYFRLPGDSLPSLLNEGPDFLPLARYLQQYAGFPVYKRSQAEYLPSGEAFYKKVLEELEHAERYIFLEFFIIRQGQMLDSVLAILERKAKEGLDIRLIYDDLGCFMSLPSNFVEQMDRKGIKCIVFNTFRPILSSLQNNRDHRKLICIDGKTAFTGGINLADEYINIIDRFGHWKDAAVMLRGEAAWSLTLIFLQMWNLEPWRSENYPALYPWKDGCPVESDGFVQPYADSPLDNENVGEHVYIQIINNAKDYVYINTPYLVVDDNLISALTLAAKSGVDVRIITPHRWDKKIVAIVSRSYYRQLIGAGVRVYEYTSGFNHSKTFVSDDRVATVGTTNLDYRSLYLHFECGVVLYHNRNIAAVKEDFLNTLPLCHEITQADCARSVFQRVIPDALRIFAPLM
jgi:cardiolipin synthase